MAVPLRVHRSASCRYGVPWSDGDAAARYTEARPADTACHGAMAMPLRDAPKFVPQVRACFVAVARFAPRRSEGAFGRHELLFSGCGGWVTVVQRCLGRGAAWRSR